MTSPRHAPAADERQSPSGLPVQPVYRPADGAVDYAADLGDPGRFPFTRGVQASMYRGRLWTMRQYAGFGTAAETNQRFRLLLDAGQTGLSVAFDLPTPMGIDSASPPGLGAGRGCWPRVGPGCPSLATCRRRWASTRIPLVPSAGSAVSASRSTRSRI